MVEHFYRRRLSPTRSFRRCAGGNRRTVVCIIEAMKVMNEIKANKGVIANRAKMQSRQFAGAVSVRYEPFIVG